MMRRFVSATITANPRSLLRVPVKMFTAWGMRLSAMTPSKLLVADLLRTSDGNHRFVNSNEEAKILSCKRPYERNYRNGTQISGETC